MSTIKSRTMAEVKPRRVEWVWPGYIPRGKIVVFDGDPSTGKSSVALDLVARLSSGADWPDGTPNTNTRRDSILLIAEDGVEDTTVPRLIAADADLSRIRTLDSVVVDGRDRPPQVPRDIQALRRFIAKHQAGLVVFDVWFSFFDDTRNSNSETDSRTILRELSTVAEATGCTMILIRHLNKNAAGSAKTRGTGSMATTAAARAVYLIGSDPEDRATRVMAPTKLNVAKEPPALRFALVDRGDAAGIEWLGSSSHTADSLVGHGKPVGDDMARIIAAVRDAPVPDVGTDEVAEITGLPRDKVRTYLNRAAEAGRLRRGKRGRFMA